LSAEEAAEKAAEKALAEDLATNPSARGLHALINAAAPFMVSSLIAFSFFYEDHLGVCLVQVAIGLVP
jgi:hypothetical protein